MKKISVLLVILLFSSFLRAQSELQMNLKKHVSYLASDDLKGRTTGTKEEELSNDYVLVQWIKNKKTKIFKWEFEINYDSTLIHSNMIGCFVNNKKDSTILISAHIDHIGFGGKLSQSFKDDEIHNGADDNASGVAWLIELQKELADKKLNYTLLFVPFTAHEIGLFGSEYLSNNLPKKAKNIALVINADMIGRQQKNPEVLYVSCQDALVNKIKIGTWEFKLDYTGTKKIELLDTKHFLKNGIPCVTISTGQHLDYHKTTDKSEYINYEGLEIITRTWARWICEFASLKS
jgi:Zn-dependent M28 family amino/carboxypeptidase